MVAPGGGGARWSANCPSVAALRRVARFVRVARAGTGERTGGRLMSEQRRRRRVGRSRVLPGLAAAVVLASGLSGGVAEAAGTTLYVDKRNPSCTNSGQGTASAPYCTISAAAAKATAGKTVRVAAGTYAERVKPAYSGTALAPVVYAADPGVVVSGAANGFRLSARSWITVRGFTVRSTTGIGIYASDSSNLLIEDNDVAYAGQPVSGLTAKGISLSATSASRVSGNVTHHNTDAGIYVGGLSSGIVVAGNTSYANARGYTRAAAGIDVRNSPGTVVDGNRTYGNEDSGINIWSAAQDCLVVSNVVFRNGDHGIDLHKVAGARVVSNTVHQNVDSGIEATGSTGSVLTNNISSDNGINSPRTAGNIRTDSFSAATTVVDHSVLSLSAAGVMVDWAGKKYTSLAAFRTATGQEARGVQANPAFVDAAGGNFRLTAASPAIDSADSGASGQPDTDADGLGRVDVVTVADTGVGPRAYDDRGAHEFRP